MNAFFQKTLIPNPVNINWQTLWPEIKSPTDPTDIFPRCRSLDENTSINDLWPTSDIPEKLNSVNLNPSNIRVFRWAPNKFFTWHIDAGGSSGPTKCALNWIVEGAGDIQWNSKLDMSESSDHAFKYKLGELNDYYEMSSDGNACLVNTAIPHRLVNMNNYHRVSISMLVDSTLSYKEVYNRLKSVNLI